MNATPPEAKSQYSRGIRAVAARFPATQAAILLALVGAGLAVVAEFTTLYSVHLSTYASHTQTVSVGTHNSYALIPIAILAWVLALGPARTAGRTAAQAAFAALASLGLLSLGIALIGDLPDTHAHGITTRHVFAATTAGLGLYLETLGAVLVLAGGGLGLLQSLLGQWPSLHMQAHSSRL